MQETKDPQTERHRFFITWLPVQGDFARSLRYAGPPGALPFFVTPTLDPPSPGTGVYNLWQLQRGLVYCWDKEPKSDDNVPKAARRRILRRLGEMSDQDLPETVSEVNDHVLGMIGPDEGLECAVNGLDICRHDPEYTRLFLEAVAAHAPRFEEASGARALRALTAAAAPLTRENAGQDVFELGLAAQAAALAVLDEKKALSDFYVKNLEDYKFDDQDLGEFAADISVRPGAPLKETFSRLADLLRPAAHAGSRR